MTTRETRGRSNESRLSFGGINSTDKSDDDCIRVSSPFFSLSSWIECPGIEGFEVQPETNDLHRQQTPDRPAPTCLPVRRGFSVSSPLSLILYLHALSLTPFSRSTKRMDRLQSLAQHPRTPRAMEDGLRTAHPLRAGPGGEEIGLQPGAGLRAIDKVYQRGAAVGVRPSSLKWGGPGGLAT